MAVGALMGTLRVTRKGNATTIDFDGPFFTSDPLKQFDDNVDEMLKAMAREGVEDVRAQVESHRGDMPGSVGWSQSRVAVRSNFPWREGRGYSLLWTSTKGMGKQEATRTMAAMSTIEGRWHPFRITKNRLNKSKAVNNAELTKGFE
jgi:hypothetical protein